MSGVRVLVGTRKGAFVLTSDGKRQRWDVSGPHFSGWEIYHMKGSPVDPDRLYASQTSGWFGQVIQRSDDRGKNWHELTGLRGHGTGPKWQPGAGGMGLHTIVLDPSNPDRMFIAISAAGAFRTDDAGKTWKAINRGLKSPYLPEPTPEVGFCVHRMAMHRSRPGVLFMQLHQGGGAFRTDNAGDSWQDVKGNLPTDFGFPIDVHAHEPDTVYAIPMTSDSHHFPPDGKLRVYRSRTGGGEWGALTPGLPPEHCYVNVLRDANAVDSLRSAGLYF